MSVWLQFWKEDSQISIWLAKKTAFTVPCSLICFVRQKRGWKGQCFDKQVKTLKCGWHPPDAGELALLQFCRKLRLFSCKQQWNRIIKAIAAPLPWKQEIVHGNLLEADVLLHDLKYFYRNSVCSRNRKIPYCEIISKWSKK